MIAAAVVVAIIAAIIVAKWARARQERTGQQFKSGLTALALIILLPAATFVATRRTLDFSTIRWPVVFNLSVAP